MSDTGAALIRKGAEAIGLIAKNLGSPEPSSTTFSADSFHPTDPTEPDDPEHQPDRAPSEDPSKVDIKAPYLEKAGKPAFRLSGDDLVKNLERLHGSIIDYIGVVNKNTLASFEYVQAKLKSQDASLTKIVQRSDRMEREYKSLDSRLSRFDKTIASLKEDITSSKKKAATEQDDDRKDADRDNDKDSHSRIKDVAEGALGGALASKLAGLAVTATSGLLNAFPGAFLGALAVHGIEYVKYHKEIEKEMDDMMPQIREWAKTEGAEGAAQHAVRDMLSKHPEWSVYFNSGAVVSPGSLKRKTQELGRRLGFDYGPEDTGPPGSEPSSRPTVPPSGPAQRTEPKKDKIDSTLGSLFSRQGAEDFYKNHPILGPIFGNKPAGPAAPAPAAPGGGGKPQGSIGPVLPQLLSKMFGKGEVTPATRKTTPDILAPLATQQGSQQQTGGPSLFGSTYGPPEGATGTDLIEWMKSITAGRQPDFSGRGEGEGGRGTGAVPGGPTFRRGVGPGAFSRVSPGGPDAPRRTGTGGYEGGGPGAFKGDPASLKAGTERFFIQQGQIKGVDASLVHLIKESSKDLPPGYRVEMISGHDARSTGTTNHPGGVAMDVRIYDDKGKAIPHTGFGPGFKEYEKLYQSVNERGKVLYPDNKYIWGGTWISSAAGYGDRMHYQRLAPWVQGSSQTMAGYDPESGARGQFRQSGMSSEELGEYKKSIHGQAEADYKGAAAAAGPPAAAKVDATKDASPASKAMSSDKAFSSAKAALPPQLAKELSDKEIRAISDAAKGGDSAATQAAVDQVIAGNSRLSMARKLGMLTDDHVSGITQGALTATSGQPSSGQKLVDLPALHHSISEADMAAFRADHPGKFNPHEFAGWKRDQDLAARKETTKKQDAMHSDLGAYSSFRPSTNIEDVRGSSGRASLGETLQMPHPGQSGKFNPYTGDKRYSPASQLLGDSQPAAGTKGNYLAGERGWIKAELERDPKLRQAVVALVSHEQAGKGDAQRVTESLFNRMNMMKQKDPNLTLRDYLSRTGNNQFYGPLKHQITSLDNPRMARGADFGVISGDIDSAIAGGNLVRGFTDQGSQGDPNYAAEKASGQFVESHGELYGDMQMKGAREYRERQQRLAREGYGADEPYGSLLTKLSPEERQKFPSTDWQGGMKAGGEDITSRFATKQPTVQDRFGGLPDTASTVRDRFGGLPDSLPPPSHWQKFKNFMSGGTGLAGESPVPAPAAMDRPHQAQLKETKPPEKSLYPASTGDKERGAAAAKAGGFGDYSKPSTPPGGWGPAADHKKPGMTTGHQPVAPAVPSHGGSHRDPARRQATDVRSGDRSHSPPNPQHHPDQLPATQGSHGGGQKHDPDNIGICSV
jgi:hypothetical protein